MVLVLAIVASMISIGTAKVTQAAISSTNTNKVTLQAQQYAQTEADIVRYTNYSDLFNKSKAQISGTDFYRQVTVGAESTYDSKNNIKQKICTVNVYKGTESIPRSSLKIIRLNKGETDVASVPQGTILPWYGNLSNIPSGFALCNGQNGTPDLRDRFLVGAGSSYKFGNTGGTNTVILSTNEMPSHAHSRGTMEISGTFSLNGTEGSVGGYRTEYSGAFYQAGTMIASHNGHNDGGWTMQNTGFLASRSWTGVTSYEGGNQAHENRPPYYALYYIMKL